MTWELILKADFDFVFQPDSDWLGLWNPDKDMIYVNLSAITKHIRMGGPNAPKGFEKDRPIGPEGQIDRRTERDLTNAILDTLRHESIHAATHEMVEDEIKKISEQIMAEMRESLQDPNIRRQLREAGHTPELPSMQSVFNKNKNMYYMLLQEWSVRLMEGRSKRQIIHDLTGYISNRESEIGQQVAAATLGALFEGQEVDPQEIMEVMEESSQIIGKMKKWLMESLMDVQANIDVTFMGAVEHLDVEENMPDWFTERMDTRRRQMDEVRGERNE